QERSQRKVVRFARREILGGDGARRLTGLAKIFHSAEDVHRLGILMQKGRLSVELSGKPEVVLIQKSDEGARGRLEAGVSSRRHAGIGLVEIADLGKSLRDRRAAVRGAIVHDNDFEWTVFLADHALQSEAQILFSVVDGNDDADQRRAQGVLGLRGDEKSTLG